jgi:hypothetical protein
VLPRSLHDRRQRAPCRRPATGLVGHRGTLDRDRDRIEQAEVAPAVERGEQRVPRRGLLHLEPAEQLRRRPGIGDGQGRGLRPKPLEEDVGVTHVTELRAQPLELVPQPPRPLGVEQRPEGPEVGAEAASCDTRLVDVLGVATEPHARIVPDEAHERGRDRTANDVLDRR